MSCNNVALSTPRGTGTSGYVQSNKFQARPKPAATAGAAAATPEEMKKPIAKGIAEHERKRRIEAELLLLSETLGDQGYTEAEIEERVREARRALEAQTAAAGLPTKRF